ncbi:MAG: hypothetical protein KC646_07535 [Candidatus Cloacimonetes bacterium]|nr:hypothetical protein [Candidatus Cloacimonadota bacterium]
MALNFKKIYEDSILGVKKPPQGLFKKNYLVDFLNIYSGEFLHSIQDPLVQENWINNSNIYKKLLLFYYNSSFLDFSTFFLRTYESKSYCENDLLLGFLQDLARRESSDVVALLKLIAAKNIVFSDDEQKSYLILFYQVHFFDLSVDEKAYYFKELNELFSEEFLSKHDLYKNVHVELDQLKDQELYDPLIDLIKSLVSHNKEAIDKSYLNFLLSYHNFSSGLSRSFTKFEKQCPSTFRLLKESYKEQIISINWQYFQQLPTEQELRDLLQFLKDRARKTFFRDFVIAMVLSIGLSYLFEPQNVVFWVVICLVANVCEYYFAHYKINKIYYMYRLKMPCLSYMSNLHPLLLYMDFEAVEVKDPYEIQLLSSLRKDPWLYFPIRF